MGVSIAGVAQDFNLPPAAIAAACRDKKGLLDLIALVDRLRTQLGVVDRSTRAITGWVTFSVALVRALDGEPKTTRCIFDLAGPLGLSVPEADVLAIQHLRSLEDTTAWSELTQTPGPFRKTQEREFPDLEWRAEAVSRNVAGIAAVARSHCDYMSAAKSVRDKLRACSIAGQCSYEEEARLREAVLSVHDQWMKRIDEAERNLDKTLDRQDPQRNNPKWRHFADEAVGGAIRLKRDALCGSVAWCNEDGQRRGAFAATPACSM